MTKLVIHGVIWQLVSAIVAASQIATAQTSTVAPIVNRRAVWQAPSGFTQKTLEQCPDRSFPALGACLVAEMRRLGASEAAVAFAHRLDNEAYLRDLQMTGKVDVAYIYYPFRANENEGCLLVNGSPAIVDVDALALLPQSSMRRDPAYTALLAQYPKLSMWPGDRSGKVDPVVVEIGPDRTQRFIVHYRLRDGCHACAQIGVVSFAFEFERTGRLLGVKYLNVRQIGPDTARLPN